MGGSAVFLRVVKATAVPAGVFGGGKQECRFLRAKATWCLLCVYPLSGVARWRYPQPSAAPETRWFGPPVVPKGPRLSARCRDSARCT
jgi:hypothetical protein